MRTLYHFPLSAPSRMVRIALAEKGLDFDLVMERIWERRSEFLALSPSGDVPVLVDEDGTTVTGGTVVLEYLDEVYRDPPLLGPDPIQRAETRRLFLWFERKFDEEVTRHLVGEKVAKRFLGQGTPDSQAIRAGKANIQYHLDYIGWLSGRRNWLAGDDFSYADIAAGAQLSCIDFLGDVPWDDFRDARDWYARIKSRPSFRAILTDTVLGVRPPAHYADLDF